MKDVLELIIKNLVENKDEVSISETIDNDKVVFAIKVNQKDIRTAFATGKSSTSLKVRGDYEIDGNKIIFHIL